MSDKRRKPKTPKVETAPPPLANDDDGGEVKGSVRANVSLPRELKARMDSVTAPVNWSAVAAQAFEAKLLELESTKETTNMDEVIERLKAAAELEDKEEYQAGFRAGQQWAKDAATPKQLRRLNEYIDGHADIYVNWFDVDYSGWNAPWGATGHFALAVLGIDKEEADRDAPATFWERAVGEQVHRIEDADFFQGFGGALDIWEKVQDKL